MVFLDVLERDDVFAIIEEEREFCRVALIVGIGSSCD
jgi:hypothetical protein